MTDTKELATPHNTHVPTGYNRCRCDACRPIENAYNKRRRYLKATGRSLTIVAAPAADHIRWLLDEGSAWDQVCDGARISKTQLYELITGRQKTIGRARAARILTLRPKPVAHVIIDATGTRRRLHALVAAGHGFNDIAAAAGLGATFVSDIIRGRHDKVRVATAETVRNAYDLMSTTTGSSVRSIRRGQAEGWALPTMWDGIDLDDPAAFPDFTGDCGTPSGYWLHRKYGIPYCGPCRASIRPQGSTSRSGTEAGAA